MPLLEAEYWTGHLKQVLEHYDEPLLRRVASRLFKPRNQWPREELIERFLATLTNAAVVDRRLAEVGIGGRRLLAAIGHSRQPRWKVGSLVEILVVSGMADGTAPIFQLLEEGLLYPDLGESSPQLGKFEQWLGSDGSLGYPVIAHPAVTARTLGEDPGLPTLASATLKGDTFLEADGLEWPLRLAAVWQQIHDHPLRLTQQGSFFKRDLDRLRADPTLNGAGAEGTEIPDGGLLAVALANAVGLVIEKEGELQASSFSSVWETGLLSVLETIWAGMPQVETWNPLSGWTGLPEGGNPYPSSYILALLLLAKLAGGDWAAPEDVEAWILAHHPYWFKKTNSEKSTKGEKRPSAIRTFLLGLAYPLRMVQLRKNGDEEWVVRLSPLGRWLLGLGGAPSLAPAFPKTLMVQPNLEIVAYRQGLTPALIAALSHFAAWKSLGAACTLQLLPETVYRALESGWSFETIVETLERHGMHAAPPAVVESLRTWSNKRDRLSVYPSAALFEFATTRDLNEALSRGLPGVRLSERLLVVPNESAIDYRHFRLIGTRDYGLPPDQCVEVEEDGVTLTIDSGRSDLLLESELKRFAEPLDRIGPNGKPQYRVTPASLSNGQVGGFDIFALEEWFPQRTGQPVSPAVRLLATGGQVAPLEVKREWILQVASPVVADGLEQWPGTRALVMNRLGPTTLVVPVENLDELRERLRVLGIEVRWQRGNDGPSGGGQ